MWKIYKKVSSLKLTNQQFQARNCFYATHTGLAHPSFPSKTKARHSCSVPRRTRLAKVQDPGIWYQRTTILDHTSSYRNVRNSRLSFSRLQSSRKTVRDSERRARSPIYREYGREVLLDAVLAWAVIPRTTLNQRLWLRPSNHEKL
jgi:hypothetical protein